MNHQKYAYIRVSSRDQNETRQVLSMEKLKIDKKNIFIDKQSGCDFNRPAYQKLLKKLKKGDVLYIKSIDRLGRNYKEIISQWQHLSKEKKIDIVVLDMPLLDTRCENDLLKSFVVELVLQILSFVAENERTNIRARQAEGIEAAKIRGVRFGRPKKPLPENFDEVFQEWKMNQLSLRQASEKCHMPTSTFYYKAKEISEKNRHSDNNIKTPIFYQ